MKNKVLNVLKVLLVAALLGVIILNYDTLSNLDIRALITSADSLVLAAVMVLGVYFVKSLVFVVPASLVYIAVGMAFETWQALVINTVGIMIEIICTYFLGKFLGKDAVTKKLSGNKAGEKLLNMKSKNKNLMVFTVRFTGIPIDFSSLFMGAFDFNFLPYFFMSLLGILPRVFLLTVIGDGFYDLIPMKYIITAIIVAIPVAVVAIFLKKIIAKRKKAE
ncbi:MAG: VTT domain-containing protein [Clostridia bacterium]|nr:VTT domain-containing protein [Clostridia bacterium]